MPGFSSRSPRVVVGGLAVLALAALALASSAQPPQSRNVAPGKTGKADTAPIRLHNGWTITPAGKHVFTGDTLTGSALSPDGKTLAVSNGGGSENALTLIDTATGEARQRFPLNRAQSVGLAFAPDGKTLYVGGGNSGQVHVVKFAPDGKAELAQAITVSELYRLDERPSADSGKAPAYLSGLAVSPDGKTLYAANLPNDTIYALELPGGTVKAKRTLGALDRPGVLRFAPDGKTLYAALWGKGQVLALDPATLETRQTMTVGAHPNDLLPTRDGKRLFVSCGNADAVFVVDPATGQTGERLLMTLTPAAPAGATPSALALSPDEKRLYVANSDNNSVAVVEVETPGRGTVRGFIPTAHYPTVVAVSPDGKRLFVGSSKGIGTGPNGSPEGGKIDPVAPKGYPYIVTLLKGVISTVETPDLKGLAAYTKQVYANCPYTKDALKDAPARAPKPGSNAVPSRVGDPSPIKHVLYVIKENRTYDQVFGDMTDAKGKRIGNGDPNLCLFGEDVTPNHHALAREFVLLDNTYCDGEVSVDGHHWTNGAYVPDFMQRTWPAQYGGKGAPPLTVDLAATPTGRVWDQCRKANVPFRTYYYHTTDTRSEEWAAARGRGERDYVAADIFIKDVERWERDGGMPRFMVMALSEDHTRGTRPGAFTPKACVASNDLALGKIVEALSKSRYWKETAIFVIEDDAQNGPDHVDAHRTMALVISPYTRRGAVDSTFYTTCSVLRTMELILGLQPMSQYDASATPMYNAFTNKPDLRPYTNRPARIDLAVKNGQTAYGAQRSLAFDFSEPDRLTTDDEDALNRILWHSVKGESAPYPGIVRRPLFVVGGRPVNATETETED
jgi:YVTN family beta-propeller protein